MARRTGDDAYSSAAQRRPAHLTAFDSEICGGPGGYSDQLSFPSQPPDIRNWFSSYQYESQESPAIPDDLGSALLSLRDESETQEPSMDAIYQKSEDPQTTQVKYSAQPHGVVPNLGSYGTYLVSPEANACLELKFEGKSESELYLLRANGNSIDSQMKSMKRSPAKIKCQEQCSDRRDPTSNLELSISELASNVAHNVIHEGPFPNCEAQKGIIVSTRCTAGRNATTTSISRVTHEDIASNKEIQSGKLDFLPSRNCQSDSSQSKSKPSHVPGVVEVKKKRSLRQVLGDEFLMGYKEDHSNVIPTKTNTNLASEEPKDRKDRRRDAHAEPKTVNGIPLDKQTSENDVASNLTFTKNNENPTMNSKILPTELVPSINFIDAEALGGVLQSEQYINRGLGQKQQSQGEKRSALTDKTNQQEGLASEDPGKWRCPRKNKPYMGPPMKQLRMDNWLRRVN